VRQFEVIENVDETVRAGSVLVVMEGWSPQHGDYVVLEVQGGFRCERWTAATAARVVGVICRRSSKLRAVRRAPVNLPD